MLKIKTRVRFKYEELVAYIVDKEHVFGREAAVEVQLVF